MPNLTRNFSVWSIPQDTIMSTGPFVEAQIPADVMQMLQESIKDQSTVNGQTVDKYPDHATDLKDNPVVHTSVLNIGKYKDSRKTVWQVYQEDKQYIAWIRSHINNKSHSEMKQFKIFISFVDKNKMDRINMEKSQQSATQMPVAPMLMTVPKDKKKSKKSKGKMPETETEWETIPMEGVISEEATRHWGRLAVRVIDHDEIRKQKMIRRASQQPQGIAMMAGNLMN